MSTQKFEKLIDLIINEDQERAEQLFHEIVVEKSREIYESLMEDDLEEDQTGGLLGEIEMEEEGSDDMPDMAMEDGEEEEIESGDFDVEGGDDDMDDMDDDMGDEMGGDMGDADMGSEEPATKDDIMNLEDKLDELMAAFEEEFGDMSDEEGEAEEEEGEAEEEEGEEEEEEGEEESGVMESVQLKKVGGDTYPKFGKMGDDGAQKKSPVAANSGAAGMASKPVKFSGDSESVPTSPKNPSNYGAKGETKVKHADQFQNSPNAAKGIKDGKGEAAPKPVKTQASGVNTKDIVPESRVSKKKRI